MNCKVKHHGSVPFGGMLEDVVRSNALDFLPVSYHVAPAGFTIHNPSLEGWTHT